MLTVFGSLNVDMLLNVVNMPHPGETRLCNSYKTMAGGKGANQAVAAARAGSNVNMYGAVGDDEFGYLLRKSLQDNEIDTSGIWTVDEPTGCATVCVDESGENMIILAQGANLVCKAQDISQEVLRKSSHLLLQMEIDNQQNWAALKLAQANNCKVVLNMAPVCIIPELVFEGIDYLLVNKHEAKYIASQLFLPSRNVIECAAQITKHTNTTVVITLGSEGVVAADKNQIWQIPSLNIKLKDATGAGDAFVGNFAAALDAGKSLIDSLVRASIAGSLTCLRKGAQNSFPTLKQVEAFLDQIGPAKQVA